MRVLIAGVGNIFFGDDAFGCEVARALSQRPLPEGVYVKDFGIRSYDLAFTIMEGYDAVILLDATQTGRPAGALTLIEPKANLGKSPEIVNTHAMNLMRVLELLEVGRLDGQNPTPRGKPRPFICLVGCEPTALESEEIGLSPQVQAAIPNAVSLVEWLARSLCSGDR